MWQVTRDTWQVTRDTWHVTRDRWHMTHSVGWTFYKNFSSLALPVWDWQCFEYISTKPSVTHLLNYKAVYRTAPATPGLLKTVRRDMYSHTTDQIVASLHLQENILGIKTILKLVVSNKYMNAKYNFNFLDVKWVWATVCSAYLCIMTSMQRCTNLFYLDQIGYN